MSAFAMLGVDKFTTPYSGPFRSLTAAATLSGQSDHLIYADVSGGSFTITLPSALVEPGTTYWIKRTDTSANVLTVTATAGLVEGGVSATQGVRVSAAYSSDGTNWWRTAIG